MQVLLLVAVLAVPPLVGSIAVVNLPGAAGLLVGLAVWLLMQRDASQICMVLMRRWQLFGRDLFLVEQDGRHRWVDALELKSMQAMHVPCRVRRREFRILDPRWDDHR